jgi:hypothetical protein
VRNRWIRFLLAVLAIGVAAAAAYRVVQDEQQLAVTVTSTRKAQVAAEAALSTIEDLKAALHAYVAPGQGLPFWSARAALLLDKLRSTLIDVDNAATAAGGSLGESLDVVDRLAAAEQRARDHVRSEQALLAGDVIFNEVRDLLDGLRVQVAGGRDRVMIAAGAREAALQREQMMLVAGAVGVLAFVMLLLVPTGRRQAEVRSQTAASEPPGPDAGRLLTPTRPIVMPTARPVVVPANVGALASLCSDIASVTETSQIEPLLDRARTLLGARGLIVWLSSSDRMELHPAAAAGYDSRVITRLGPIHRETSNLTANAFRENAARTSAAAGTTAAALAVPLPSPDGPAGVFSAELAAGTDVDDNKLATARVIAAQLGPLLGSIPGAPGVAADAPIARSSS